MDHKIKIEDLPPIYQIIAKIIGIENAMLLGKEFGGTPIYFPKLDRLSSFFKERDRQILKEYNGHNTLNLAKKHGITLRRIYEIVKKQGSVKRDS